MIYWLQEDGILLPEPEMFEMDGMPLGDIEYEDDYDYKQQRRKK